MTTDYHPHGSEPGYVLRQSLRLDKGTETLETAHKVRLLISTCTADQCLITGITSDQALAFMDEVIKTLNISVKSDERLLRLARSSL